MFAVDRSETNLQKAGRQLGITKEEGKERDWRGNRGGGLAIMQSMFVQGRERGELKQASLSGKLRAI